MNSLYLLALILLAACGSKSNGSGDPVPDDTHIEVNDTDGPDSPTLTPAPESIRGIWRYMSGATADGPTPNSELAPFIEVLINFRAKVVEVSVECTNTRIVAAAPIAYAEGSFAIKGEKEVAALDQATCKIHLTPMIISYTIEEDQLVMAAGDSSSRWKRRSEQ